MPLAPEVRLPPATLDFRDPNKKLKITRAIFRAVETSFVRWPMPSGQIKKREVQRRFNIAFEGYKQLRNECSWSSLRAMDHLTALLDEALEGIKLNRTIQRAGWFAPSRIPKEPV